MTTPDFRALALLLPLSMLACDDGSDTSSGDGDGLALPQRRLARAQLGHAEPLPRDHR